VDDTAQGGDIDLYIQTSNHTDLFGKKLRYLQLLEDVLGEQKIDVIFNKDANRVIEKEAMEKGIPLDIDQYIFRFSKLQDTMGDKLFRLVLQRYEGTNESLPLRNILNKLEKYGCINSAKEWTYLRKLRNEIAQQYDDEAEEMTQAINALLTQKKIIIDIYTKLKTCVQAN